MASSRRLRRLVSAAVVGVACAATASSALAQVPDKAMAEKFFLEGRDLMKAGQTALACDRFEKSQRIEPRLGTLLNVATCHEQLGKTGSAWGEFIEAKEQAKAAKDLAREEFANEHANALEPRLSRVEVTLTGDARDVKVTLDGRTFDAALLGTPVPHRPRASTRSRASAPGRKTWTSELVLPPGPARTPVKVPPLAPEAVAPIVAAPPPAPVVVAPAPAPPRPADESKGWPTSAYVAFGVGAAGLVVGSVTGAISLAKTSSISSNCTDNLCGASESDSDLGREHDGEHLERVVRDRRRGRHRRRRARRDVGPVEARRSERQLPRARDRGRPRDRRSGRRASEHGEEALRPRFGRRDDARGLVLRDAQALAQLVVDELLLGLGLLAVDEREEHRVLEEDAAVVGRELGERDVVERLLLGRVGADLLRLFGRGLERGDDPPRASRARCRRTRRRPTRRSRATLRSRCPVRA